GHLDLHSFPTRRSSDLVAEGFMDSWEMSLPEQSYAVGKQKYFTNHYNFASRSTGATARYLLSRFNMKEMNYFKAVAENTLNANRSEEHTSELQSRENLV